LGDARFIEVDLRIRHRVEKKELKGDGRLDKEAKKAED
jgi:hypothetical protein